MAATAQFGIKTLLIVTAICAALFWAFFSPPHFVGLITLSVVYCLLPGIILAGIVFHRGYWQAFFMGCAPANVYLWLGYLMANYQTFSPWPVDLSLFSGQNDDAMYAKTQLAVALGVTTLSGLAATAIWRWAKSINPKTD